MTDTNKEVKLALFRMMLYIRRAEEAIAERYTEQEMRCPTHLCIGQEAISAGVCSALTKRDTCFSTHRGHGHYLAKGGSLKGMIAEIYGKATGCAGGYGGSMHLVDKAVGFMGCAPIVGGTVPLAVGMAWAHAMKGEDAISVAFFGDGCFEEGVVHECLNFAALKKIPILFLCENNGLSCYTDIKERQPERAIHAVVRAHGWQVDSGDGNKVLEVLEKTQAAVKRLRAGQGPQFLEFFTDRWLEHCGPYNDDKLGYRPTHAQRKAGEVCPLKLFKDELTTANLLSEADINQMEQAIKQEVKSAFDFAIKSPGPKVKDMPGKLYA